MQINLLFSPTNPENFSQNSKVILLWTDPISNYQYSCCWFLNFVKFSENLLLKDFHSRKRKEIPRRWNKCIMKHTFKSWRIPGGKSSYWEDVTEKSWSIFQILIFSPFYRVILTNLETPVSDNTLTGALQNYSGSQSILISLLQIFSIVNVATVFSNWTSVQIFRWDLPLVQKHRTGLKTYITLGGAIAK